MSIQKIKSGVIAPNAVGAEQIGFTPVNKAGDTMQGSFNYGGNLVKSGLNTSRDESTSQPAFIRTYTNLAEIGWYQGTGPLVLQTNITYNSAVMCFIQVSFYAYGNGAGTIDMGFYTGENNNYNVRYSTNNNSVFAAPRLSRLTSTGKQAIIFGATGSSYAIPIISVTKYMQGWGQVDAADTFASGWSWTKTNDLSAYTIWGDFGRQT